MIAHSEILVCLVLYEKSIEDSLSWQSLCTQIKPLHIFICDNSKLRQNIPPSDHRVQYIHRPDNPGVSTAYNLGANWAKELQLKWIILLDDDTHLPPEFIETLCCQSDADWLAPHVYDEVGLLSPFKVVHGRGKRLSSIPSDPVQSRSIIPINSGSCLKLNSFQRIGGFDEKLPLDFSDFDYFLRAHHDQQMGRIYPLILKHSLSNNGFTSVEKALSRFVIYARSAMYFGQKHGIKNAMILRVWLRSLSLSLRFKSFSFIKVAWRK